MKGGSYALFLVADNQLVNKGDPALKYGNSQIIPYEDELISCIRHWRMNGGSFSDIPIYVHCPSKLGISLNTLHQITKMGAHYNHEYLTETDSYACGYLNVPLSGKIIESRISEDYIIHIDLDMRLIRKPEDNFFDIGDDVLARIGINEWRPTDRHPNIGHIFPFESNTGFIVSRKESKFYEHWYDRLWRFLKHISPNDPAYSIYEERIIDIMYFWDYYDFEFIDKYQINGDVSSWTDEEVMGIKFFHGHLHLKERNEKYWELYLKRYAKAIRNQRP